MMISHGCEILWCKMFLKITYIHISSTILIITDVLIIIWYINNSIVNLYLRYTYFPYFYIIPLLSSNDTHI